MQHWAYYNKEAKIFILLPSVPASASLIFAQFMQRPGPVKRLSESFWPLIFSAMVTFWKIISISIEYKAYIDNCISTGQFKIFEYGRAISVLIEIYKQGEGVP
jgi:hypothetical protein